MGKTPLVSVYMPTHNRAEMAVRAIKSVLNQTYKEIEIVVCDDGSKPNSNIELEALLVSNGHRIVRNEEPKGACAARNKAIKMCTGEYITGLDDDDEMPPERISKLLMAFDNNDAFVASSYFEINKTSKKPRRFDSGYITFDDLLHYNKVGNQILTPRARMESVGYFDESLPAMQDYDMWIRLCEKYGRAKKLEECLYLLHTEHEQNQISSSTEKLELAHKMIRKKHGKFYSRQHWQTSKILEIKIKKEKLSIVNFFRLINSKNYKLCLAYLLQHWR